MKQIRLDRYQLPKISKTNEGYLRGEAVVTRTGVFKYLNKDGSVRLELRHPDDVLTEKSLETLKQIPITIEHPTVLVDATNTKLLSVGLTGETIKVDGENIKTSLTINVLDGIQAVENGKEELSLGYELDLIEEEGVYNGQAYTHRQTDIKYNHLAIVSKGRAGANARLNFDSFDCCIMQDVNEKKERELNMTKINIDAVDVEVEDSVAKAFDKLTKNLDAEKGSKKELEKEIDGLKARLDEKEIELKGMKETNSDEAISEKAKARVELITKASKFINADGLYAKSDRDIMSDVIKHRNDGIVLDEKSMDYVTARFDAICETLNADEAIKNQQEKAKTTNEPTKRLDAYEIVKSQWKGN